jgi:aspartate ammonia-lyase
MERQETDKARINFGRGVLPRDLIRAMAEVKLAAVSAANKFDKRLTPVEQSAMEKGLTEIRDGIHDSLFDIPLHQGGAGTSLNMIINETAAALAGDKGSFDPIETVNRYQSTNDIIPTAVTVMTYRHLEELEKGIIRLQEVLVALETRYGNTLMTGRTEMQDGLPMTAGQLFGSWAGAVQRDRWRFHKLADRLRIIPLGGTAIGTCFNAPAPYIHEAEKNLREITGLPLSRSQNLPDEISHMDKFSELASGYRLCAETLMKLTGDLLYLCSTPVGEIRHPDRQYGSSIMAAKSNPVQLELIRGLAMEVQGEALKISLHTQNGQLQLNAWLPFTASALIAIHSSLGKALETLSSGFLGEMTVNEKRMETNLVTSPALLNSLLPLLGYHRIKEIQEDYISAAPSDLESALDLLVKLTGMERDRLKEAITRTTLRQGGSRT